MANWKIISFFAKRARGMMARHAIEQRATTASEALVDFHEDGYRFAVRGRPSPTTARSSGAGRPEPAWAQRARSGLDRARSGDFLQRDSPPVA